MPGGVVPRPIPGRRQYQGLRQMLALVYTSHCLVYTRRSLITPVASWWGALLGPIDPSGAIPASLAGRARAWSAWLRGSWLGSAISNTVGGRDLLSKAAASRRAVSTSSLVSGRAAWGSSGYSKPGLCCPASLASL